MMRRSLVVGNTSVKRIVIRSIEELKVNPQNPRQHSKRQIRQIAASIKAFGFNVPILVDGDGNIIAGTGRFLACQLLGWTEVPTIQLGHLSPAQLRGYMIADNRLNENSKWDEQLLAQQFKELAELDLDFDLEDTGFEMAQIDLRIEGLSGDSEEDDDPADQLPAVHEGPPVTQLKDLWVLGSNRVRCESALNAAAYSLLMAGRKAAMAIPDPPYNLQIDGHVSGLGAIRHREFEMGSGEMDKAQFTVFLTRVCSLLAQYSRDGSLHFIFMDWRHLGELLAAGSEVYGPPKNLCVWVKRNGGMGSLYRSRHELIFVFKLGRGRHRNNVQLGQFGRNRTNVWEYPSPTAFGKSGDEANLLAVHPTSKPVALVADAIMDASARGEIVLDPFLGSGTTVIAAQRTGRRCYGLEIDPLYVDATIRRWQSLTGEHARHAESGRSFNELEQEARAQHAK